MQSLSNIFDFKYNYGDLQELELFKNNTIPKFSKFILLISNVFNFVSALVNLVSIKAFLWGLIQNFIF